MRFSQRMRGPNGKGAGMGFSKADDFSPLSLSPLLWVRSDLGITLNGGNVSAWADQSGNGNHLTQGTAANQPTYTASLAAFNSRPCVTLDGNDALLSPELSYGAFTIFMAVTGNDATRYQFNREKVGVATREYLWSDVTYSSYVRRGGGVESAKNLAGWASWGNSAKTITWRYDGTHAGDIVSLNGADSGMTSAISSDPGSAAEAGTIYLSSSNAFSYGATFSLAEMLIFNSALSSPNVAAVEAYLRRLYAHY